MTACPYCSSERFHVSAIRADVIDRDYHDRYGYWFNRCSDCDQWSLYKNDVQLAIENPSQDPLPNTIEV